MQFKFLAFLSCFESVLCPMRMDRFFIFIIFLLSGSLLSGCTSIKIEKESYEPLFACSGDTVSVHLQLDKKVDRIRIKDATGTRLAKWSNVRKVDASVENIQSKQLPFDVYIKKVRSFWPDIHINKKSKYELFDNEHWSKVFDSASVRGHSHIGAGVWFDESYEDCTCWEVDEDGNCIDQECWNVPYCYEEYPVTFELSSVVWKIEPFSSSRIRITGVENLNDYPISVNGTEIASGREHFFSATPPQSVRIEHIFSTPLQVGCGSIIKDRTCAGEICLTDNCNPQPDDSDIQNGRGCYEGKTDIRLQLICDQNE